MLYQNGKCVPKWDSFLKRELVYIRNFFEGTDGLMEWQSVLYKIHINVFGFYTLGRVNRVPFRFLFTTKDGTKFHKGNIFVPHSSTILPFRSFALSLRAKKPRTFAL